MKRLAINLHGSGRLLALTGLSNMTFWMLWPAAIVRVAAGGWSAAATGLFGSAAPTAMVLALPMAHWLVARLGPRTVTGLALALVAASAVGSGLAPGGSGEWLWSLLLGAGTGLRWIAVDSWIADLVPPRHSGRILSLGESIVGLGFAAGPALASLVGLPWLAGLSALLAMLALLLLLRQPPLRAPSAAATAAVPRLAATMPGGAIFLMLFSALLGGINETGFAGIAALFKLPGAEGPGLLAASAVGLGSFVGQYLLGIAADRWGGCRVLMLCSAALAAGLGAIALWPASLAAAALLVGAAGGGLYTVAVVFGLQARRDDRQSSVRIISAAALAYSLGSLATPAAVGMGLEWLGPAPTLLVMALLALLLLASFVQQRGWRWRHHRVAGACLPAAHRMLPPGTPHAHSGQD